MLAYLVSTQSTITSYDFDHLGNRVDLDSAAFVFTKQPIPTQEEMADSLIAYELSLALENLDDGWIDLAESLVRQNLMVKINKRTFQTFTYCDGNVSLVTCENARAFAKRVAYEREFYKLHNTGYTLIESGDEPQIYDNDRKTFIV